MGMYGYITLLSTLMVVQRVNNVRVRDVVHRESDCKTDDSVLRCQHHIPLKIPRGITEVYIADLLTKNEEFKGVRHVLRDSTWRSVKTLDITDNVRIEIYNLTFTHLGNLKTLGFHCSHLTIVHKNAFVGMYNLQTLDFSGCSYLRLDVIINALNKSVLPKLRALNLKELGSSRGFFLHFNKEVNNFVNSFPIEWICLSGTNVFMTFINTTWPFRYFDVSNTTLPPSAELLHIDKGIPNLEKLNMSRIPIRFLGRSHTRTNQNKIITPMFCTKMTKFRITVLDISYIWNQYEETFDNCTFNMTSCLILSKIQTLVLKGSNIKSLNSTVIVPKGLKIKALDLSFNKIEYVSSNVIMDQLRFLNFLFLQDNCLNKMENDAEFGYLLNKFTKLLKLNIADNRLTHIPYTMFDYNPRLRSLDLHGNNLEYVTFKIKNLQKLEHLDFSGNRIKYIDNSVLTELSIFETSAEMDLTINFDKNLFICKCKSVDTLFWLSTSALVKTEQGLYCILDGDNVAINTLAIELSEYLCYRDKMFAVICSVSACVVICILIAIICAISKYRRKKQLDGLLHYINLFNNNKLDERYLAFLSYHRDDDEIIQQNIFQKLNVTLKLSLAVQNRDVICVGDRHFQPGKSIFTEIMRCITESCIVICVVSQSFCASDWCRMEVQEACKQAKPIILVFREHVDIKLMPAYLRTIFERQVRVKLEHRDAEYILVPNIQTVCDSIKQLAYEHYKLHFEER